MRFNQGYLLAASAVAVLLASQSAAWAATSIQGKQFRDWGGNCETAANRQQVCYLEQVLSQGNEKLMVSVIGYPPGQADPTIVFELPAGIHVQAGLSLSVDNKPPFRFKGSCTPKQCTAGVVLDQNMLQQFKKGRQAIVSYTPAPNQPLMQLPLSLMGITAGLGALR